MSDCNLTDYSYPECVDCDYFEKKIEKLEKENQALRQRLDRAKEVLIRRMKLDCLDCGVPIEEHEWHGILKELEEAKK